MALANRAGMKTAMCAGWLMCALCALGCDVQGPAGDELSDGHPVALMNTSCNPPSSEPEQILVGDWNGDGRSSLALRTGHCVQMDSDGDGMLDAEQCYGNGDAEDGYLVGDWDGDGRDNLAVRRGNCVLMDTNFDGSEDLEQCYGNGNAEDGYLVGDWDGDGRDNLAVRRGHCVLMDTNFGGGEDLEQCYGNGDAEDGYLVGDWDGDGRDNLAVRRGNCVVMDTNFDGNNELKQCYGNGDADAGYLVGDWDADGRDNLAVMRDGCALMDTNFDGNNELKQCIGSGSSATSCGTPVATLTGKRFTVFYQISSSALALYADPVKGLPMSPHHVHVFAHSGASQAASPALAQKIHGARSDFLYAPGFDLHEYSGWLTASNARWLHGRMSFRDEAIGAGARPVRLQRGSDQHADRRADARADGEAAALPGRAGWPRRVAARRARS